MHPDLSLEGSRCPMVRTDWSYILLRKGFECLHNPSIS
jgi:hypothetical protein